MASQLPYAGPRGKNESARDYAQRGLRLLELGEFVLAHDILEEATALFPDDDHIAICYAGLLSRIGRRKDGHKSYRKFLERNPLEDPPRNWAEGDPLLLIIRGYDKTRPIMGKESNGEYAPKLRGGHFSTEYLLTRGAVPCQTYTIPGEHGLNESLLPNFDVMLNTIAEPDIENASLKSLEAYLDRHPDTDIINRPAQVRATTRDGNYRRLKDMGGFTFPRTRRFRVRNAGPAEFAAALTKLEMDVPVILRRVGTQTGRTTQLITSAMDLFDYVPKPTTGEFYAIDYREILWQGEYFRKLRLFSIDGEFYPVVCHLDKFWNVHGGNRKEIMRNNQALMAEEKRFLADWKTYVGPGNADILYRIAEATGLEFFGIDFTVDDDGKIFIYELNASMRHSFDHAENFPYKLPYDQATSDAFESMVLARIKAARSRANV